MVMSAMWRNDNENDILPGGVMAWRENGNVGVTFY